MPLRVLQFCQEGILHIHPASLVRFGSVDPAADQVVADGNELTGPVYVTPLQSGPQGLIG